MISPQGKGDVMSGAKVLVVEDEGLVALSLQRKLQSFGYEVPAVVSSGEEAVRQALESEPDLILMDIMLDGGIDGVDAAGRIRSEIDVPIVYLTAYSDHATVERAKATEPFGYLIKPFEERELFTTIEMALCRHTAHKKVSESRKWLYTTLRSIGDAVITTDTEGSVTFLNPVAEELTGWSHDEAVGLAIDEIFKLVSESSSTRLVSPVHRALRDSTVVKLDDGVLLQSRDSRECPIDDSAAPIKDDRGHLLGCVLVFRDVSEKRAMEGELRQHRDHLRELVEEQTRELIVARDLAEAASRARSAFLANMSHEIRTPLTGVIGMAELLHTTNLDQKQERYAELLLNAGQTLLAIINDILDFSKIDAGKLKLSTVPFSPSKLASELVALVQPQAQKKSLELRVEVDESLPAVLMGDPVRLKQILMNLLMNAVKFTERGRVDLIISKVKNEPESMILSFEVADTGIGIPAEAQGRIFESFEQAETSTFRKYGGTGLGLAISHKLVELMGGKLRLESTPGEGSRFWFDLDLSRQAR
jgi:PAS domain S-box-containing protein